MAKEAGAQIEREPFAQRRDQVALHSPQHRLQEQDAEESYHNQVQQG